MYVRCLSESKVKTFKTSLLLSESPLFKKKYMFSYKKNDFSEEDETFFRGASLPRSGYVTQSASQSLML